MHTSKWLCSRSYDKPTPISSYSIYLGNDAYQFTWNDVYSITNYLRNEFYCSLFTWDMMCIYLGYDVYPISFYLPGYDVYLPGKWCISTHSLFTWDMMHIHSLSIYLWYDAYTLTLYLPGKWWVSTHSLFTWEMMRIHSLCIYLGNDVYPPILRLHHLPL